MHVLQSQLPLHLHLENIFRSFSVLWTPDIVERLVHRDSADVVDGRRLGEIAQEGLVVACVGTGRNILRCEHFSQVKHRGEAVVDLPRIVALHKVLEMSPDVRKWYAAWVQIDQI